MNCFSDHMACFRVSSLRNVLVVAMVSAVCTTSACLRAEEPDVPRFLQPGSDYLMQFAGTSPFKGLTQVDEESDATGQNASSKDAASDRSIEIFKVVGLAGDAWILVEHPRSRADVSKWHAQRIAKASLTPQSVATMQATKGGVKQLEKLQDLASAEIETSRTWINLNHVVAIRKPPIEPSDFDPAGLWDSVK